MKKIFGLILLAALLSAGSLSIAGDKPTSQCPGGSNCGQCPGSGTCPVPCVMCG